MAPGRAATPTGDELDDILNAIVEGGDVPSTRDEQAGPVFASKGAGTARDGLGIDEEIIVTKKRIPIPKLDDNRLLSDPGIPRLRRISKDRLRFKGKGHEYGDIARMLNMYQLWLDDLYPRAKFADALAIIEKVGHTKRMQMMRKEWLDEAKPRRHAEHEQDGDDEAGAVVAQPADAQEAAGMEGVEHAADSASAAEAQQGPDEDELDALLAESAQHGIAAPKTLPVRMAAAEDNPFADEMEAMADMQDMW
ncbi:chromosome segregation in meiosis-related protein [Pleosporales sp. CAS-2024a]